MNMRCPEICYRPKLLPYLAVFGVIFGIATLYSGGNVLFGSDQARTEAGDYVPFVVWFNFLAGLAYIGTGAGLLAKAGWSPYLARAIVALSILVFAAFGIYALSGNPVEARTTAAMILRIAVWMGIACVAWRTLKQRC